MRLLLAFAAVSLVACSSTPRPLGPGHDRALGAFSELVVEGAPEVDVTVGQDGSARVACSDDDDARIALHLEGSKLIVEHRDHGWTSSRCKVTLTTPRLTSLEASGAATIVVHGKSTLAKIDLDGAGSVDAEAVEGDGLDIESSGASNLTLRGVAVKRMKLSLDGAGKATFAGTADSASFEVEGAGHLDARSLVTESTKLALSGAGGATVHATRKAIVSIEGVGSARVLGNPPERSQDRSGLGSVHFE